jgi:Cu-Zn family superoxide dismutase
MMRHRIVPLAIGAAMLLGCDPAAMETEEHRNTEEAGTADVREESGADKPRAVAVLEAKSGSEMTGEAFFVPKGGELSFGIHIENASPGEHAVHIHELGDCSAADASSAGEHWNPTAQDHGKWGVEPFHLGDIGNIEVGSDGDGSLSLTTDLWSLEQNGESSVLEKAIVVHEQADDFTTQPGGDAGDRLACGVIQLKEGT